MYFTNQPVIPAVRSVRDFERLLSKPYEYIILLDSHVAQLQSFMKLARQHKKKLIIHADLVLGLKHDEAGAQFLCQVVQPDGIISTHSPVIKIAKKHRTVAIQRIFLLDSHSLETSYRVIANSQPNFIEVLPGALPNVIREIQHRTNLPVLAGGFIRTRDDIQTALLAGATAVTTSQEELWDIQDIPRSK
jgi:glycerol uptake operon antiterminator